MIIGFVRHGNTEWNTLGKIQGQTDIPLSELGVTQAQALAQRLYEDDEQWDAIISSDLQRAHGTATIIAAKLGIPHLDNDTRLRERCFGDIEGTTESERLERWGADWRNAAAGQESDAEVRSRGLQFLEAWQTLRPNARLLVVTHGGFLSQMFSELCSDLEKQYLNNMSYSILEHADGQWSPLLYNCSRHLNV